MTVANNEKMLKALLSAKNPSDSFIANITIGNQSFRIDQAISVKNPYDNKIYMGTIDSIVYLKNKSIDNKHLYFLVEVQMKDKVRKQISRQPEIYTEVLVIHVNTYLEYCKRHNLTIYGEIIRQTESVSEK